MSGSAADRMQGVQSWQQQQAQQQAAMRSVLFQRSGSEVDDAKLESEMEAGKISSRCAGPGPPLTGACQFWSALMPDGACVTACALAPSLPT